VGEQRWHGWVRRMGEGVYSVCASVSLYFCPVGVQETLNLLSFIFVHFTFLVEACIASL
jgi:hypothetical protein